MSLLLVSAVGLVFVIFDGSPLVAQQQASTVDDADSVHALMRSVRNMLKRRHQAQEVSISEQQVHSLLGLANRALPNFSSKVNLQPEIGLIAASYAFSSPFDVPLPTVYLNVSASLSSGARLHIDDVSIGQLTLSGQTFLCLVEWLVNTWTSSDIATNGLNTIKRTQVNKDYLVLDLQPIQPVLAQLNEIKNGLGTSQDTHLRERTAYYLKALDDKSDLNQTRGVSLTQYLSSLFQLVESQRAFHDPVKDNQAAILALAVYTGHHRLANLVGDIQPVKGRAALPRYRPLLAGRTDLTQHFVLSAAIYVLSQQGITVAIGEFKELMDRANGGSGYSFVDLAADMAGLRFAEQALSPERAMPLQSALAKGVEQAWLFPDTQGLAEGLTKQAFSEQFETVDSQAYKDVLIDIQTRIDNLPLSQL